MLSDKIITLFAHFEFEKFNPELYMYSYARIFEQQMVKPYSFHKINKVVIVNEQIL